ncbi:transposase [Aetokthonos hydrillicola Thurmond2011]|uniref:Transposase n=2 Tax=Aetokthonos TaxID=1550243 RepID=A0AAP5MAF8_9CYAN|nr:RNA-guided endonuclease TnpB family protein [Aetokthonos hydrillicola]MBO3463359.1 IS200/IS605 family element transposase accessory protein TnpB [Aetokthonos hydrillicola CCALA 1050]MBW4583757.1 transposase [Aetokthonos hydrillicola CCALA 1050]MDR9895549.1 transposase [Aetokthonos hydrillicola Thurmond2011]
MLTNYVYKLRPNVGQSNKMDNWIDMLRSQYNWSLADRITQYNQQFIQGDYCDIRTKVEACPLTCFVSKNGATGEPWKDTKTDKEGNLKNPRRSAGDIQITALPELKKSRPWYADIDSTVLQQNVKRLDTAYKNFFDGRGFPKFKNRSTFSSFTYTMGIKVQGNKIYLPKIGWMRFFNSRPIPTGFTIKAATIRKRQDGWYISIRIEDKTVPDYVVKPLIEIKSVLGCDLGINKLVHLSDGHQVKNPKFATNKKIKRRLKIRQRRVNRKVKGSKNRKKAATRVGKLHKKIADKRQAYQWEVAGLIASRKVDAIAVEDLNVSGMLKRCRPKADEKGRFLSNGQSAKKGLNRSISDASWNELTQKIEYMAVKSGKILIKVNPKYTSQKCNVCGHVDASSRDKEKFICVSCNHIAQADINAAKNIKELAISNIASIVLGDSQELEPQGLLRPKQRKETSVRRQGKRTEPGNLSNQDIERLVS